MIDWERVGELHSEIGDVGFSEVLELFFDEVEMVIAQLGGASRQLEDDLHFLKGSAWNLGFAAFGAICQDGERRSAAGHSNEIDLPAVHECYMTSKTEFMARVGEFCRTRGSAVA